MVEERIDVRPQLRVTRFYSELLLFKYAELIF